MKSAFYTNIGTRGNNEDFLAHNENIFIVCDGVGGLAKGEVASRFVTETLIRSVAETPLEPLDKTTIQQRLALVQDKLNDRLDENPDEKGMGTTLTAVFTSPGAIYLAHIGDSRIYYIRPSSGLFWRTTDHSVVAELAKAGIIKESEAKKHPMSNRITRAIQANTKNETSNADITQVTKAEAGDLIFLCTDGVLEALEDKPLLEILCNGEVTIESKIEQIEQTCKGVSRDNNTALLIELEETDVFQSDAKEEMSWQTVNIVSETDTEPEIIFGEMLPENETESISENQERLQPQNMVRNLKKILRWAFGTLFLLLLIAYGSTFYNQKKEKGETVKENTETQKPDSKKKDAGNATKNSVIIDNKDKKADSNIKPEVKKPEDSIKNNQHKITVSTPDTTKPTTKDTAKVKKVVEPAVNKSDTITTLL